MQNILYLNYPSSKLTVQWPSKWERHLTYGLATCTLFADYITKFTFNDESVCGEYD